MSPMIEQDVLEQKPRVSLRALLRSRAQHEVLRVQNPLRSALPFLLGSALLGALCIFFALYTPCFEISLSGETLGLVQSREALSEGKQKVEAQVSALLAQPYTLTQEPALSFRIATKDSLLSQKQLHESLLAAVPEIKPAFVLSVDGVELAASPSKGLLDETLNQLAAPHQTEQTIDTYFANEMRITRKYIPSLQDFSSKEAVFAALQSPQSRNTVYEVQPGDTQSSLQSRFSMSREDFLAANPSLSATASLHTGQIVLITRPLPTLSVGTVELLQYSQPVASPVREVGDASLYQDQRRVLQQGSDGVQLVNAQLTKINGQPQYEQVLSQFTTTQATETVVAVGTKERPPFYATGSLQWPTRGQITSPFGYRNLFGSEFHKGLDIANSYGTAIFAADSGVVSFSGYQGSFGNLIIIDHGDGTETYYAHSSTNHVSVGQGVTKGDLIASMGRTGRTTGSHCHFEYRIGGQPVNPAAYLP